MAPADPVIPSRVYITAVVNARGILEVTDISLAPNKSLVKAYNSQDDRKGEALQVSCYLTEMQRAALQGAIKSDAKRRATLRRKAERAAMSVNITNEQGSEAVKQSGEQSSSECVA